MAAIRWNVEANGDWGTAADWDLGRLPAAGDDVVVDTADPHTVNHRMGDDTVSTLTVGADHFVVSGGSLTIASAASFAHLLTVSGGSLELGGAASVGRFNQGAGTVSGTGTLAFGAGIQAFNGGAILTIAGWSLASGAATSVNEILSYGGAFSQAAGSTVAIAAADKLRLTGAATLAGTVAGAGTLTFAGGTQVVEAGVEFTVANWVISNAAATRLDESLTYAGAFIQAAATNLRLFVFGDKLRLTGAATLAGTVTGSGTLTFAGGTQAVNAGATLQMAEWVLSNGAATSLNTDVTYSGDFVQAAGTSLSIARGRQLRLTGNGAVAGSISGPGKLVVDGGNATFNPGAALTVSAWQIKGGEVRINENLTYAGDFTLSRKGALAISVAQGDTLTLTGRQVQLAMPRGSSGWRSGTLAFADARIRSDVIIGGTATMSDIGHVIQAARVFIGDRTQQTNTATLSIAAGAVYQLEIYDIYAYARGSDPSPAIVNNGLLINGGAGEITSSIFATVLNHGTIESDIGRIAISAITGDGSLVVDHGGTLEVGSAAASLTMTFKGGNTQLSLPHPDAFAATISGFAPTDIIEFFGTTDDAATLGPGDTLVITSGATTIATLQLSGDYSGATFKVSRPFNGEEDITVTFPGAPAAAPFIAAMAGLGAGSHGPAPAWTPSHADAWRPMLSAARPTHFA